jgi:ATPase family associated with various cellular activities (AAA)
MDFRQLTSGLAMLTILATVFGVVLRSWQSIKNCCNSVIGVFVIHAHLDDETTARAVLTYLVRRYPRSRGGQRTFGGRHDSFRDGKYGHIPYEVLGNRTMLFWRGWLPFWFVVREEKQDAGKSGGSVIYWGSRPKTDFKACLVFFRFTLDVEEIIRLASRSRNEMYWAVEEKQRRRFFLKKIPDPYGSGEQRYSAGTSLEWFHEGAVRLLDHEASQLGRATMTQTGKAADQLYFPRRIKDLIQEVWAWHGLKDWYLQRNIPWKRGWCLYGPPGTGKTALVRAIAEDLDMPLFIYSLGHMLDRDLERSWEDMQAHTPCVALFEDFDTVFHGRENVYGKPTLADQIAGAMPNAANNSNAATALEVGKLSFGCLLNCLDGVVKGGGIFTVITTNHVDKLDRALGQPQRNPDGSVEFISTRPGRIDKAIELGYMEREDKKRLARRIFFDDDHGYRVMVEQIEREPDKKETPAQFQEACAQLALAQLWDNRKSQPVRANPAGGLAVGKLVNGFR